MMQEHTKQKSSEQRPRIKICGLTRLNDARLALQLGAWALGFIFYEKSPRATSPGNVALILQQLAREGLKPARAVGVFVNADALQIRKVQHESGIDTVQLHGDESFDFCNTLAPLRVWKAFRIKAPDEFPMTKDYGPHVEAFLYDAAVDGHYGGSGQRADWSLLKNAPRDRPMLIAGGLNDQNAKECWHELAPWALDLSSGVESSPGIKDARKLARIFT